MHSSKPALARSQDADSSASSSTRPLRVMYVHHVVDGMGGSTKSLLTLIKSFPAGAVDCSVACPPGSIARHLSSIGIKVASVAGVSMLLSAHGVPMRGARALDIIRVIWNLAYLPQFRRRLMELRPDIVHLNERGMLGPAIVAKRLGYPVVMHARSVADFEVKWARRLSLAVTNRWVDRVVAIDKSVENSLSGVARISVVYNPLELDPETTPLADFHSEPPERQDRTINLTFLAGLLPFKGIWELMDAAILLKERGCGAFKLRVAGGNARPPAFYRSIKGRLVSRLGFAPDIETPLSEFIQRKGLRGEVELLGFVKDLNGLLTSQTDILVFPSHLNGTGRSVFEAGMYGIPSVVALHDKVEDIVEHEVTGLICREKDAVSLADTLEALIRSATLRRRLGLAAREKYRLQFSPAKSAGDVLSIYRDLLGIQGPGPTIGAGNPAAGLADK